MNDRYVSAKVDAERFDQSLDSFSLAQLRTYYGQLLSRGALITHSLHSDVTHVIMTPNEERYQKIQERIRSLRLGNQHSYEKRILRVKWVEDCLKANELLEPLPEHLISY